MAAATEHGAGSFRGPSDDRVTIPPFPGGDREEDEMQIAFLNLSALICFRYLRGHSATGSKDRQIRLPGTRIRLEALRIPPGRAAMVL